MGWRKLNIVTQKKGDQWECTYCGYKKWQQHLGSRGICKKCGTMEDYDKPNANIYGTWTPKKRKTYCPYCKDKLRFVPKKGHPLSKLAVDLRKNDGHVLKACINNCSENGE